MCSSNFGVSEKSEVHMNVRGCLSFYFQGLYFLSVLRPNPGLHTYTAGAEWPSWGVRVGQRHHGVQGIWSGRWGGPFSAGSVCVGTL